MPLCSMGVVGKGEKPWSLASLFLSFFFLSLSLPLTHANTRKSQEALSFSCIHRHTCSCTSSLSWPVFISHWNASLHSCFCLLSDFLWYWCLSRGRYIKTKFDYQVGPLYLYMWKRGLQMVDGWCCSLLFWLSGADKRPSQWVMTFSLINLYSLLSVNLKVSERDVSCPFFPAGLG